MIFAIYLIVHFDVPYIWMLGAPLVGILMGMVSMIAAVRNPDLNVYFCCHTLAAFFLLFITRLGVDFLYSSGDANIPSILGVWLAPVALGLVATLGSPRRTVGYAYLVVLTSIFMFFAILLLNHNFPHPTWSLGQTVAYEAAAAQRRGGCTVWLLLASVTSLALASLLLRLADIEVVYNMAGSEAASPPAPDAPARLKQVPIRHKFSVKTPGDSDRIRSVGRGQFLHMTDLQGDHSLLRSSTDGTLVWEAQAGEFFNGVSSSGRIFFSTDAGVTVRALQAGGSETLIKGYRGLGFNPGCDKFFALNSERVLCCIDAETLQGLWSSSQPWPEDAPLSCWFTQCGRYFMAQVESNEVEVWRIEPRERLCRHVVSRGDVTRIRPHPTRPLFAMSSMSPQVAWIDLESPTQCRRMALASESRGVGWTEDGRFLVTINSDQYELLWVLDFERQQLFEPFKLPGDPWGVAAWGKNQIAVAHSEEIAFYEFDGPTA